MKKSFIIFLAIISVISVYATVPQMISYQAVVRNNSNELVVNSNIGMQISVMQNSASGTVVYKERHFPTTNANGLVNIQIGIGTIVFGSFSSINWSLGNYYIKSDFDLNGGANYTISGTSQILSVPYAFYAQKAENEFSGNFTDLKNKPSSLSGFGISDEVNERIALLKTEIYNQIVTLTAEVNSLKTKVANLEAVGNIDSDVAAAIVAAKADIMSKVVTLEVFNALSAKVAVIEGVVADLNTRLNQLGTIVDGSLARIAYIEEGVAKNTQDIGALKADANLRFSVLESLLNIKNGRSLVIDDIKAQLVSQLALINANTAKITTLQTDLTALAARVTTLETKVAANTAAIAVNTAAIATLKAEVVAIKATN